MTVDVWHVGELTGDDGRTIRDENGLTVVVAETPTRAREIVDAPNLLALLKTFVGFETAYDNDLIVSEAEVQEATSRARAIIARIEGGA
jgi:hypothetical protein